MPIHVGNGHTLGEAAGSTAVTVNIQQMPTHLHALQATNTDIRRTAIADPAGNFLGAGQQPLRASPAL